MFALKDGVMYLTKGDSRPLTLTLTDNEGQPYTMQTGDKLILTVKESPADDADTLFSVESTSSVINILHSHTDNVAVGQYSATVRLETNNDDVYTFFPPNLADSKLKSEKNWANFWITPRCE